MNSSKNKKAGLDLPVASGTEHQMIDANSDNKERPETENIHYKEKPVQRGGLRKAPVVLQDDVQKHIGRCLQETYGELVNEPVPDHLIKLLDELAAKDKDS